MKLRHIIAVIGVTLCLLGCGRDIESENIHNEINGLFASVNDTVYYVNNNILYQYDGKDTIKLSENSISVQTWNNTVYFIYTDNYKDYSLYKVNEGDVQKVFDLNSGAYQQSIVYDNKLYSCMDNEITVYDLQTKEHTVIETENPIARFCVNDNIVYYWSIDIINNSLDDYINVMDSGNKLNIFEGKLYSFNINSNKSKKVCSAFAEKDAFFVAPIKHGIVFFDPEKNELNRYTDGEIKTLLHGDILNMITDDENIYYSMNDNIIHKININTANTDIFTNNTNEIYGFNNQYIYGENGNILKRN